MKSVLYYPYIRVPETPWFSRVLLYWDSVGSIVPGDYLEEPGRLGPYMQSLVKEGLVRQVVPGYYLGMVPNFKDAFLNYLDNRPKDKERKKREEFFRIHSESLRGDGIHMKKLQDLGEELVKRGIARKQKQEDSPWYEVEQGVARDFMAYLAGVLGQAAGQFASDEEFYPITDESKHLRAFVPKNFRESRIRDVVLEAVLPAPAENIEPARLSDFKNKYKEPLKRFRELIEDEISQLAVIQKKKRRKRRLKDVSERLVREREELVARMQEAKGWPRIGFGDFCAVVGGSIATVEAVKSDDWRLGIVGAAFAVAPAVYNAFIGTDRELKEKPLAYASLAAIEYEKGSLQDETS